MGFLQENTIMYRYSVSDAQGLLQSTIHFEARRVPTDAIASTNCLLSTYSLNAKVFVTNGDWHIVQNGLPT